MAYRNAQGDRIPKTQYMREQFPQLFPSTVKDPYYYFPPEPIFTYNEGGPLRKVTGGRILIGIIALIAAIAVAVMKYRHLL